MRSLIILFALLIYSSLTVAAPDFGPVDMGSFYTSLPPLDPQAKLGTLVTAEKITTSAADTAAWKIAYVSSDIAGRKTLVTGIVAAPTAPGHDRPIMAWAHGTTGTAQNCGPSQVLNPAQPLNQYFLPNGNSWTDFGIPAMASFIKAGYVIVATDYQGLGGGGKHQYTVAATQARDVINAIRAVTQLSEANTGKKAIIYGWSQGGGATLAAASLPDYINATGTAQDGIELVGFVAMAPFDVAAITKNSTQSLMTLQNQFAANIFDFTHYAQNIWGMVAAFPELKLDDIFTPDGATVIDGILQRKCMHVATDTFNYTYGKNYKKLLRPTIRHASSWLKANITSSINPIKPIAPVIIYFGNHDTTVPPIMGQLYYKQMCELGGNISHIQLPGTQDHFTTPASAEPYYVKWVADRFNGKPTTNGCSH